MNDDSIALEEAIELLRAMAWLHGLVGPDHPDWTADEHEEQEERLIVDRVFPWLVLRGAHRRPFGAVHDNGGEK